jgi:serine/threonine protein kinase
MRHHVRSTYHTHLSYHSLSSSYGAVYKAIDRRDGMVVAIKVLKLHEDEDTSDLLKEISILRECKNQYIVSYKGTFECGEDLWIVMEYCGAGSLADLMAICGTLLDEAQIAAIMRMALVGLDYLHKSNKIHRDIKSGNLLLNHDGECKLADFGVSAELTSTMAKRKTVIGTPYWMAPEVLKSIDYDGKVLYTLYTIHYFYTQ